MSKSLSFASSQLTRHLTPDHAAGLVNFWGLMTLERDYFLELVNHSRAATANLRKMIEEKMTLLKENDDSVTGRIKRPKIGSRFQQRYYSSWHYSAIHILLTVSNYRTLPAIAERLNLSRSRVLTALSELEEAGLARKNGNSWESVSFDLHLPARSLFTSNNHLNWRNRAIQDSLDLESDGVHFTAVYSLSRRDFRKIRAKILELISESREVALASAEEEVFSFCCDLFQI
jgi:uncharacterized protein (TIGR02147 family)